MKRELIHVCYHCKYPIQAGFVFRTVTVKGKKVTVPVCNSCESKFDNKEGK